MFGCINEFIFRGVVRIFSELRTILQIALHHSFLPEKKTSLIKDLITL